VRLPQPRRHVKLAGIASELLEHRQIANRERGRRAPAGQLVERRKLLRDQQRIAQGDVRHPGCEANPARPRGRGRQQRPRVTVVHLVG
jgi:hypothetical protein